MAMPDRPVTVMRSRKGLPPTQVPLVGTLDERLGALAQAIDRKADLLGAPTFAGLVLQDSSGQSWVVTVSTSGVLQTTLVSVT